MHVHRKNCQHRVYRLTCESYDALCWRSGGRCEICRVRAEDVQKRPLYIDHDGRIGDGFDHVRGLVCAKCNTGMRYVDNGHKRPTSAQQRYLDESWFWTALPPERQGKPWLPEPTSNRNAWVMPRTWHALRSARR